MTMREEKRRRLETRGWKIGGTREFLGLSTEEEAYIELKLKLADAVRRRRQESNLTQVGFARVIRSSQSRVAKIEAGDRSVSLDLLVRSLFALGTSERELAAIIARAKPAA